MIPVKNIEGLIHASNNSFYFLKEPKEVSEYLVSMCTNATECGLTRLLDLKKINPEVFFDGDKIGLEKEKISELWVIEVSLMSEKKRIYEGLGYSPLLRALVVGYKFKKKLSEVIPFNFELSEKFSL